MFGYIVRVRFVSLYYVGVPFFLFAPPTPHPPRVWNRSGCQWHQLKKKKKKGEFESSLTALGWSLQMFKGQLKSIVTRESWNIFKAIISLVFRPLFYTTKHFAFNLRSFHFQTWEQSIIGGGRGVKPSMWYWTRSCQPTPSTLELNHSLFIYFLIFTLR